MSAQSADGEGPWPPLITEGHLTGWVHARDIVLTALMWFFFLLLMAGEFERLMAPGIDRLGIPINVKGIGYTDLGDNWGYFLRSFSPFLAIALFLVIVLVSFAFDTLKRRRIALSGPRPPPLRLTVEARHAELATSGGPIGETMEARRSELAQIETVDARSLLMILGQLDQAALTDARSLKVTRVHLTEDGHFQIRPDR